LVSITDENLATLVKKESSTGSEGEEQNGGRVLPDRLKIVDDGQTVVDRHRTVQSGNKQKTKGQFKHPLLDRHQPSAIGHRPSGYFEFKHTNIMLMAVTKWPFSDGPKYQHLQLVTAVSNGHQ
jgi:hypothetical protein